MEESSEFYCDTCEERRYLNCPTYYCAKCHYVAHVHCVISEEHIASLGEEFPVVCQLGDVSLENSNKKGVKVKGANRKIPSSKTFSILFDSDEDSDGTSTTGTLAQLDEKIEARKAKLVAQALKLGLVKKKLMSLEGKLEVQTEMLQRLHWKSYFLHVEVKS
uniref:DC1 domain-containing protein n=1 Tax=Davidia involucrata TaxID=16924 RepID=A0A5B7BK05_DAVIN